MSALGIFTYHDRLPIPQNENEISMSFGSPRTTSVIPNEAYYEALTRTFDIKIYSSIAKREFSKAIALIYWVINTNAYKLLFWMTTFLLFDPPLIVKVREELQSSFRLDGSLDIPSLQSQMTCLTPLFHESLRVSNSSSLARFTTTDTQIGSYSIKAGRRLLIPYRQLHLNKSVFGENAADFDIDSFLKNKKLASHPSYRPFSGGATYCPGRFLARQEMFMALVYLICRYDVQLLPGKAREFSRMDELKSVSGSLDGDSLTVRVTRKQ